MKKTAYILSGFFFALMAAKAQVQTIVVNPASPSTNGYYVGGVLSVPSGSFATMKSVVGPVVLQISSQGATVVYPATSMTTLTPLAVAGPATIQIQQSTSYSPVSGLATFLVEPGPFPADKTAAIGANAGNVQVTMEVSTDLVNWTPAVNGQVYTNAPEARFFRIKLQTNGSP